MSKTICYHHIVFGTKSRGRTISREKKEKLYSFITKIIQNKKSDLIAINGMEDHIHILLNLHPSVALADMVKAIKQSSSRKITETFYLPLFEGWASEYYACSVSPSHLEAVKSYIRKQEDHHKEKEYTHEIKSFVSKMGLTLYRDEV